MTHAGYSELPKQVIMKNNPILQIDMGRTMARAMENTTN